MAAVYKTLIQGTNLTTGAVELYESPVNTRTTITTFTLNNYSGSAVTVTLYIIASGASAADRYSIYKTVTLDTLESREVPEMRHTLEVGDSVEALCSANSSVSVRASGIVITT